MHPLKLNVKPQDVKLFLIGMCIVLVAEILLDITHTSSICSVNDSENLKPQPSYFGTVDVSYAKKLASTIHIYCFILTEPSQLTSQHHVQNTWVRRCTRYGFVSPGSDSLLRLLDAKHDVKTYKRKSWNSMRETLRAVYAQKEDILFYLKADHNNYIIMENVRYMLEFEDPDKPFLLGHVHTPGPHGDKISGSAGYVLSRKALKLIVENLDTVKECGMLDRIEDEQISVCAEAAGVELPASPLLVSFAGIDETMMYVLEYLLYHLRPTGITHRWRYQQPQ
ncbi:Glycoprotein-N-acetylgalactosamine 3-beta-galactosyltransferase 1 [Paragonimus westermani]|uniref:Glycoprotein-N-acetylgalactosamine 3-beta-galactosyltransferase 1 n=1 Tax=Paragonimus westermani TaxID=34504 RepID=A0A8T0DMK0_9TREM|nr:Glycoprotein-N-acetylgalactosamine 3-beta-galactosyltransferase 1 [Paragonimus westermani]